MNLRRLLWRNLTFHWRGDLAVLLGVVVGTAALTGALLVGDSLRGSLRERVLRQLGWIDQALVGSRFFREELASHLGPSEVLPMLLVRGTLQASAPSSQAQNGGRSLGPVTVVGVTDQFFSPSADSAANLAKAENSANLWRRFVNVDRPGVALSYALARELGFQPADEMATVTLHLQKASQVPRENLLGRRDASEVFEELQFPVRALFPEDYFASSFSLNTNPAAPRNVFVPLQVLQSRLGLTGRVNVLLASGSGGNLQQSLSKHLTLDDWGLVLHDPAKRATNLFAKLDRKGRGKAPTNQLADSVRHAADADHNGTLTTEELASYYRERKPYLSLESQQMLLEPAAVSAATAAARKLGLQAAPTLVYLANNIKHGNESIPYSIVAALDPSLPPPLGLPGQPQLKDDEILLADWKDSPIKAKPGDSIQLTYFEPEEQGRLTERTTTFRFVGMVPMTGTAADPDITPEFPGITDKLTIGDWNPPFPYNGKLIQKRDEEYWRHYRTTPKAYVTLATGQRLWGSRFGKLTSIRFAASAGEDLAAVAKDLGKAILSELKPEQGGFVFEPIRERMLKASAGSADFGGLFVGFSCFLIVAALLLVGLLFRLNLDRRAAEIGLLLAVGFSQRTVRLLLMAEGAVLAVFGGVLGCGVALLYAWLLLDMLAAWWPGTLDRSFLRLHVLGGSLPWGFALSLFASLLTVVWGLRILGRIMPSALVASGGFVDAESLGGEEPGRWATISAAAAGVLGMALVCWGSIDKRLAANHEILAMLFFAGGFLLLFAGLLGVWTWMRRQRAVASQRLIRPSPFVARPLAVLGVRNATRYPLRSLLTAGLLASAAFVIVAVDSFRRQPDAAFLAKSGGSGGFGLLGESDVPVFQDMNTARGQDELNFSNAARKELEGATIVQLRLRKGDDTSCLNLYQPNRPRLVGVPQALIERGGFAFQATEGGRSETNLWKLLNEQRDDGAIPVFGEANSVQYILNSGLGKEVTITNEHGEPVKLRIVGLLQDSVFQSELVMSEANFLRLFPGQEGYNYFLIETPPDRSRAVAQVLEETLAQRGFVVTPTIERLGQYLAVENTYLSTFQALGGLGLLLGALGLAVALLRSVWERRGELALLRALGYRNSALGWLILAENGFLLVLGLAIGTVSALVSVLPHLHEAAGSVSLVRLLAFLALVFLAGLLAGAVAVWNTVRAPLLPALRRE